MSVFILCLYGCLFLMLSAFLELWSARQCLYCVYDCSFLHDGISFQELWFARQCSYCLCDCLFLMLLAFWSSGLCVSVHIVCVTVYF